MRRGLAPVNRRAAVERHVEVFAERGAQRRFETAIDADLLQHGGKQVAAGGVQHLRQRPRLGLDAPEFSLGFLQGRARRGFGRPRLADRLLGSDRHGLAGRQSGFRRVHQRALFGRVGQAGQLCRDLAGLALDIGQLPRQPVAPLDRLAHHAFELVALGRRFGALGRQRAERAFAQRQRGGRFLEDAARRGFALGGAGVFRIEGALLFRQAFQHVGIVAHHALLARDVGVELLQAAIEFGLAGADAAGLLLDLRLGDGEALHRRSRRGFRLAQVRQAMGGDRLLLGGVHLQGCALADQRGRRRKRRLRLALLRLGLRPAQMQQDRLRLADVGRQALEA